MRKLYILLSVALVFSAIVATFAFTRHVKDDAPVQNIILAAIQNAHFSPLPINAEYSKRVYALFFKHIDYNKKFFTQEDRAVLSKHENKLGEEAENNNTEFIEEAVRRLKIRVAQAERFSRSILATPFEFSANEFIETNPDKMAFAKDSTDLKEQWRKYLKYQVLQQVYDLKQAQEKAHEKNDPVKLKPLSKLEEIARAKILKNNIEYFKRLRELDYNDWQNQYFNCLANVEDPHTEYFPPAEKENFDISMSGQLQGIGAQLQEKDGHIKVDKIIIGSPSWKQGHLKAGDVILKVAQGDAEPVDIEGMRLDKAVRLIRGKKGTEVRLTVRKVDGSVEVIPIVRDIVVIDDTYAQSLILTTSGHKLGYIRLPEFYSDFDNRKGGRNCADDMRKEVEKLKAENVESIIIDLRDNGGGSLYDCVNMSDLFLGKGAPAVLVRNPKGDPEVLPGHTTDKFDKIWDGPLAVMVNKNSASASEIFSAVIQDYQRGIIIGGATYGKGTVQRFINLDEFIQPKPEKPLGSIKITMQKFYRVNGNTTQFKGVIPDILLPDALALMPYGEKDADYPLPYDKISPVKYSAFNAPWHTASIVDASEKRVANNGAFNLLKKQARQIREDYDHSLKSLELSKYIEERRAQVENKKDFDQLISADSSKIIITNVEPDLPRFKADSSAAARNNDFKRRLRKDIYLSETIHVATDMASGK